MQVIINILSATFIYLLVAYSFNIIYYTTGFFNLAHAIIITLSGYVSYFFTENIDLPFGVTIVIAVIFSVLVGLLTQLTVYAPLEKRDANPFFKLIASLGLYIVLQNTISVVWGDDTKNFQILKVKKGNEIFGAYITNLQIITILVSLGLFIGGLMFLKYHRVGRNIRAVASNAQLANIIGIDSGKVVLWSFGIGSGLATIAGILVSLDIGLTPSMGFNLLLYGVVAMIIGGVGSTWGLIGGSLLLATAQNLGAYYIDSKWMNAIAYVILILFLIWKPLGFSGKRLKKVEI